jgi:hypothetical protein
MKTIMARRFKSGNQQTTNYAGKTVSYGLGLVWPVWAASLAAVMLLGNFFRDSSVFAESSSSFVNYLEGALTWHGAHESFLMLAIPLVLLCYFFGWLDDRFGAHGDGGFKGHLKSLRQGRLTTGMLKVLGIGFTALAISFLASGFGFADGSIFRLAAFDLFWIVLSTCAIALSANLINLFDLRPARASKAYILLIDQVFFIIACSTLVLVTVTGVLSFWDVMSIHFIYLLWMLGPIFAIWHFDAGERAMLGDAGANPAGALVGLYAVMGLWILLPVYVLIVLVLNLLSEKFSFSALIEEMPILKRIDMWGRPPA